MAAPSVSFVFSGGTTILSAQVNTNYNDLVNAMSDGTKDFTIGTLTVAGAVVINGAITLGNASGDDLTIEASLAQTLLIKAGVNVDIGDSTNGVRSIYFEGNNNTIQVSAPAGLAGDYSLTLPEDNGKNGWALNNNGSGVLSWVPGQTDINEVSSADYVVTDTDGYRHIHFTTANSDRTCTLPTAADNTDRIITVRKVDSGTGNVTVKGEAAGEKIDSISGTTGILLDAQYMQITLVSDGTQWWTIANKTPLSMVRCNTGTGAGAAGYGTTDTKCRRFSNATVTGKAITHTTSAANGDKFTIEEYGIYAMNYADRDPAGVSLMGISLNAATPVTTSIVGIGAPTTLALGYGPVANITNNVSATLILNVGDVIRAHTNGGADAVDADVMFNITQVARLG